MDDAITAVGGIRVGQAQDDEALTGCTVVLCESGAVVGVDVRGLAPGTRETDLCRPGTLVERAHAILLTGGSAFGLDAAEGVMRYLRERGVGFETGVLPIPIVPAAVIFDLGIGKPAWPDAEMAYSACINSGDRVEQGSVGAGTGATVGKVLGPSGATKSGVGTAGARVGDLTVGAIIVVNAFGDVLRPGTEEILAGARLPGPGEFADTAAVLRRGRSPLSGAGTNTTIGVIATDAGLQTAQAQYLASVGHDALARVIRPAHTLVDGDTLFTVATGPTEPASPDTLMALGTAVLDVVERAVVNAVRHAGPSQGMRA